MTDEPTTVNFIKVKKYRPNRLRIPFNFVNMEQSVDLTVRGMCVKGFSVMFDVVACRLLSIESKSVLELQFQLHRARKFLHFPIASSLH